MAKRSKMPQTDWTRQGKEIADTAVPYWKENLHQLGNYMENIQNRYDPYLEYMNAGQAAQQSDFMRNYQRAMGELTGNNYSATGGGYSSLGQRAYDDQQRYYNDLAARMYSQGLDWASNQADREWTMLTNTPAVWNNAYQQGQNYSNIDQYNQLVDKANDNWWSAPMNVLGDIGLSSGNPWGMAIGGALKLGAGLTDTDAGQLADSLRGTNTSQRQQQQWNNIGKGLGANLQNFMNWYDKKNISNISAPTSQNTFSGSSGSYSYPNYGLGATDTSGWKFSWDN